MEMDFRIDSLGTAKQYVASAEKVQKHEKKKLVRETQEQEEEKVLAQPEPEVISKEDVDQFLLMMGTPRMSKKIVTQVASRKTLNKNGQLLNKRA